MNEELELEIVELRDAKEQTKGPRETLIVEEFLQLFFRPKY